jgi:tetratricopeptide (TPR) repeat protein
MIAQKTGGSMLLMDIVPLTARLLVAIKAVIAYLGKMVWPVTLIPFYPYPAEHEVSLSSPEYIVALLLIAGITITCFIAFKKQKLWLAVWAYYVVTLIPVLGIVQVGEQAMADRYTYLPGLGPFVAAGVAASWGFQKVYLRYQRTHIVQVVGLAVIISLFGLMGYKTFRQIGIWKDSLVLWNNFIEKGAMEHATAYNNRGWAYYKQGQLDKALEDYNKAIAINPSLFQAYSNRGVILTEKSQFDKALEDYKKAIALNPSHSGTYNNRALVFMKMGQHGKAIEDYSKAISLNPSNPSNSTVLNNRASAFMSLGQFDNALDDYSKGIALNPSFESYYLRGIAYETKGELDKALEDYGKSAALNPSYIDVYIRMGVLYGKSGAFDQAIYYFTRAVETNPNDPLGYINRGFAYSLVGKFENAVEDLNKAIELNKSNASAYFNRGNVYLKMGDKFLARTDFRSACDLGEKVACEALRQLGL